MFLSPVQVYAAKVFLFVNLGVLYKKFDRKN